MRALLPSFDRRGLRLSSLVLAGSTFLAACDTDRPLEPTTTETPTAANLALTGKAKVGALRITVLDQNNALPTTASSQFTVASMGGGKTFFVVDNAPNDMHSMIGSVLVILPAGWYNVCQTVAPAEYVLPTSPLCQQYPVEIVAGTSTLADASHIQFDILTVGHLQWTVSDMLNQPIAGAVFTAAYSTGVDTIPDNSAKDLDKNPGRFEIKVTDPSGVTVCSFVPPKHWMFATPFPSNCYGLLPPAGQTTFLTNYIVHPEYSVFWYAQDVNGLAGPSTYQVTGGASGTFSATITDGDANDMYPGMGKLWLQLPEDGDYVICQTVAPPKSQIANPTCQKINITFGNPVYPTDVFFSLPL
jgi:hypothetical protein